MTNEEKDKLFPYFAYLYSKQLDPDKYGKAESIDEWIDTIQDNPEDIKQIITAAAELSDEDWDTLSKQYNAETQEDQNKESSISAKKGAKLKKLQESKHVINKHVKDEPEVKKVAEGTKVKTPPVTADDTIVKYSVMNMYSDGYGPKSPVTGKILNTPREVLKAARKEWKGKHIDVRHLKGGGSPTENSASNQEQEKESHVIKKSRIAKAKLRSKSKSK
jgi:hypothetical protein